MLRRIWQRAAALALPVGLAICLPPLAVIAFNLHAQSAGSPRTVTSVHAAVSQASNEGRSNRRELRAEPRTPGAAQQDSLASSRKYRR
jgi:hypothetical protein